MLFAHRGYPTHCKMFSNSLTSTQKEWQLTPVFLPGKSHGQSSLGDKSQWGRKTVRYNLATKHLGTSLMVQCLRLSASNAGSISSILGHGTKILHAVWCCTPP